jgi:2-C-methyl-D-erythritol 2,4-cyclodiphosphate synthase
MNFRVGIGIDAHKFVTGRSLVLGGVEIPYPLGLEAHSDGDVIAHAILDALLGAANLGDKGQLFPLTDPQYKDIRSTLFLEKATGLLKQNHWHVVNIDVSVMAEEPQLLPHISAMKTALSKAMNISGDQISIKGTTLEQMGFTGRKEGIAAMAVVLIESIT